MPSIFDMIATRARLLRVACLICLAYALLPGGAARAQGRFDAEAFDPAPDQNGSILNVYSARALPQLGYSLGLFGSYARHPLTIRDSNDKRLGDLIGSVDTLSLMGTLGLFERVDLGVAIPIHRIAAGSSFDNTPPAAVRAALITSSKAAFGDIRLVPRVALIEREEHSGLGLALLAPIYLPTGDNKLYAGESARVAPTIALDYAWQRLTLAANIGYMIRKRALLLDSRVDDTLRWGAAGEVSVIDPLSIVLDVYGGLNVMSAKFDKNDAPTEGLIGVRLRYQGFLAQLGGGTGFVRGVTSPQFRLYASLGFAAEPKKVEPDPDPDHDGIIAPNDRCAFEPEDKDGFQDDDGCPDPDNDNDGVPDAADRCPNEPEDKDGFQDDDGCSEPDNDNDGVPDAADRCPNEAEDKDNFQDDDGCPDPDNDNDGILDGDDQCPNEAGVVAQHGCPAPQSSIKVTEKSIELNESVYFASDSAVILPESMPLMDELAKVLLDHPELKLIVVEGHTDDRGSRKHNTTLSKNRAQAVVEAMTKRAVEANRLRAEGFGPDKPVAPNDSAENRAKNRRVQLRIEQRDQPNVPSQP